MGERWKKVDEIHTNYPAIAGDEPGITRNELPVQVLERKNQALLSGRAYIISAEDFIDSDGRKKVSVTEEYYKKEEKEST